MKTRSRYSTHTHWEESIGYSRAIRVGDTIEVSGTVSADANGVLHPNAAGLQTEVIFEKISLALAHFAADWQHVVRVKVYATDVNDFEVIAAVYSKYLKEVKPAMTFLVIAALVDPTLKLEVEVTAIL
jgi:enamine deaminase RidA (YjgF/YER057c/UK114 family)